MAMLPFLLFVQYIRPPWSHVVYMGIDVATGLRLVALGSENFSRRIQSRSPFHGCWHVRRHGSPFASVVVAYYHYAGVQHLCKVHAFYAHEIRIMYYAPWVPLALGDIGADFWPGEAVVYLRAPDDILDILDLIIVDAWAVA